MALIMMSCSSNDEENFPADELLAGTEWRYGTFYDDDYLDVPPIEQVTPENVDLLDKYFPNVELICTAGEVNTTDEEEKTQGELPFVGSRAKLTFTNRECLYYSDEGISYTTVEVIRHYSQTTTYVAQNYTSTVNPYISLEVTKDAITLYQTNPYTGQQMEHVYLELDNFKHTRT